MTAATAIERRQDAFPATIDCGTLAALDSALASSRLPATVLAYAAAGPKPGAPWHRC